MRTAAPHRHHHGISIGATRALMPLRASVQAQLIGSGCRFSFQSEDMQGWEVVLQRKTEFRHGFNQQSLVELWLDCPGKKEPIYCMGKFQQQLSSDKILVRIVEIDNENLESLQELISLSTENSLAAAG